MIPGPKIIDWTIQVVEKIRDKIKAAQEREKNYASGRRNDFEFQIGDKVFF